MSEGSQKSGLVVSGALHAGLLAMILVGFSAAPKFDDAAESIPVETITQSEVTEIMHGEREAQPTKEPARTAPAAAPPSPPEPPQPPADLRKSEDVPPPPPARPVPPPPQPPARPAPPPPQKAAEEPPAPPARPKIPEKPAKPKADDLAKLLAKETAEEAERLVVVKEAEKAAAAKDAAAKEAAKEAAQREADRQAAAREAAKEAAAKEAAKEAAEKEAAAKEAAREAAAKEAQIKEAAKEAAAREAAKEARKPKFDPNAIAKALGPPTKLADASPTGATARGLPSAHALKMSGSLKVEIDDWFKNALLDCWTPPPTTPEGESYEAKIDVAFNADGSLSGRPILNNPPRDPAWRAFADSAVRAVLKCNPLRVPPQYAPYFEEWRSKMVHFSPTDAPG